MYRRILITQVFFETGRVTYEFIDDYQIKLLYPSAGKTFLYELEALAVRSTGETDIRNRIQGRLSMSHKEYCEIKALMDLYGLAVDTQQWSLFDQIFTKDVDANYGAGAVWKDIETLKRDFKNFHEVFDATQHAMTNLIINLDGDKAKTVTYGHWRLIRRAAKGGDTCRSDGWYDDTLARTPDGWRITKRRCNIIQFEGNLEVVRPGGVEFSMETTSLRAQADAGNVPALDELK